MAFLDKFPPYLLSILRIVAGLLFLQHGVEKILHFPVGPAGSLPPLLIAAGIIELVGGILIVLGLFSRIAAFIASGEMAFAFWIGHFGAHGVFQPILNGGGLAVLFCFTFLYLAAAGPGPWTINRR